MGFNYLKAIEPLQGDSLLFTTKFPGGRQGLIWSTRERGKAWSILESPSGFETGIPGVGIQHPLGLMYVYHGVSVW